MAIFALIGILMAFALQAFLLPDTYSDSASGQIGFGAVILGILLTAGVSFFATNVGEDAGGVARIGSPLVPILYTMLAAGLWFLSPVLTASIAKGLHLLLLCGALFGMVAWTFASAAIAAEDASQTEKGAGRADMLAAAKGAQRRLGDSSGEVKKAFSGLMDDVTYADRNGSEDTAGLEAQIVAGFEGLDFGGEDAAVLSALEGLKSQVAERRDALKAGK